MCTLRQDIPELIKGVYEKSSDVLVESSIEQIMKEFNKDDFMSNELGLFKKINILLIIHALLIITKMTYVCVKGIESLKQYVSFFQNKDKKKYWFRGQSNFKYELIPSICRKSNDSLHKKTGNNKSYYLVNADYLKREYDNTPTANLKSGGVKSIFSKYVKYIDSTYQNVGKPDIQYELLSYIQHSISYSPFIDFSKNGFVALSFSLENYDIITSHFALNAAVFLFDITGKKIIKNAKKATKTINESKIYLFPEKTNLYNLIFSDIYISMVFESTTTNTYLIDIPKNDRMKYQQGTFILLNNAIIIGEHLLSSPTERGNSLSNEMVKIEIIKEFKTTILKELMDEHQEYHKDFLYDPYRFLKELI